MSFETIRDRWANFPLPVRFLFSIAIAVAMGFGVVKPGYAAFKSWKLSRNLINAEKAVNAGQMGEARDLALTVLKAGNTDIEPLRILEKATDALGDPRHGEIAKALLSHAATTDEDRWRGFKGIVDVAPLGVVSQGWATLPESCRLQSRFAAAFAARVIFEKRLAEATAVMLAIPAKDRTPELQRMLIRVLIQSGKKEGFDEAQRRIAIGFPAEGGDRSPWLELLEEMPPQELRDDLLATVRQALASPESAENAREQLMLARFDCAADEAKRPEIVQTAIRRWKDDEPVLLARFLTDLGLFQEITGLFAADQVAADLGLQRTIVGAMEKTRKWKDMLVLLDATGQKMPKYEESAWRAVVASKMADEPGKAQHWSDALGEAKSSGAADALLQVERIARGVGMAAEADQALLDAIKAGRGPLPLFADIKPLINSLESQERESLLMDIYAIYLPFEPGNPELFTRYAYLACLNRLVDPPMLLEKLELLSESFPKEATLQWVLATVYLCDDKPKKAADIFDRTVVGDLDGRVIGFRIAWLTTQVMNGRIPRNDPQVTGFPWTSLKSSERKRFGELIQSATK